ncbi:MAG: TonB-dependent receptor [Pseudomonadota bacterium]
MKFRKTTLAALLCAATPLAYAADALDEVVVTATRTEQPLNQTLSTTTVLTEKEIRNSQAADLPTLLRSVAGVEVYQQGGAGKQSSLFLRGTNSSHVLVLIDGVRVNSVTTGITAIQDLILDQVERIEVVRGNVSSVYGSDAIGGVVQIFTRRGRGEPHLNFSAAMGSHNTQRTSAGFGGAVNDTRFSLQASHYRTDGVSAMDPAINPGVNPNKNGYENVSVSGNLRHAFTAGHSLTATVFDSQGRNSYDNPFNFVRTDVNTSTAHVSKASLASDNQFTESWNSHLQLAEGNDESRDYLNGAPSMFGYRFKTYNRQLTWQNTVQVAEGSKLLLGAENLNQKVNSDTQYAVNNRKVNSFFAGYTGQFGANQFQLNGRQDRNSQYGNANTGLIGYGYAFTDALRATASYSTAYKAPSFNDLYYPFFGNANLKPERARNAEAGIHYAASGQQADLVYFDNRIRDLIAYNAFFLPVNVNQARIKGVELSYAGKFGDTGVKLSLTAQDPKDTATGQQLIRRAKSFGSFALTQQFGDWQAGAEVLASSLRKDTGGQTLSGYGLFNMTANYTLSKDVKLNLRADNLFNRKYTYAYGYNTLGRSVYAGLSYQPE